jgi:hypothetical protein
MSRTQGDESVIASLLVVGLGLAPVLWHQVSGHRLLRPGAPETEHEKLGHVRPSLRAAQNAGWLVYLAAIGAAAIFI